MSTARCLEYWLGRDLLASKAVEENIIKKARSAMCHGENFQGDLNPVSTKSIIDTCVMSILLFGSENWILIESLLHKLEAFLGEIAKRALKWPQHLSNTCEYGSNEVENPVSEIKFST